MFPIHNALLVSAILLLAPAAARSSPAPLETFDRPEPLTAKSARSEADQDRVEALALFATGRTLEQRGAYREALKYFERASRYDPAATDAVDAAVLLAIATEQEALAVRYATKGVRPENLGMHALLKLGETLTAAGNFTLAVKCYETVLAQEKKDSGTAVILHMEIGRLYHISEKYPQAAEHFAQVRHALENLDDYDLTDKDREALEEKKGLKYDLFGEAYLLAGQFDQAAAAFRKAHELAANAGLLAYNLARVALRSGKAEQALAQLETCFAKHLASEGFGPCQLLADVLKKLGKDKELIPRLEKLHAADAANVPLGYFLAGRYRDAGQPDKAEPLFRAMLAKQPSAIAYRSLAEIARQGKHYDALLAVLGDAFEKTGTLEFMGSDAATFTKDKPLVASLLDLGRKEIQDFADKQDYGQCLLLATLATEQKDFDTAAKFYEAAIKARPKQKAEVLLAWGVGLLLDDRPDEAAKRAARSVKIFQRGIDEKALPADNPAFLFYLAGALAMNDRNDDALAAARKAAAVKKDSIRFVSRPAWVLYRAKRYEEAYQAYKSLVAQFDFDTRSFETREALREARLTLSNLCVLLKRMPEAEEWLEQVLDEFPGDVGASNDLGFLWADENKHLHRALAMIETAVAAEPENLAYRDSLGWVYYRLGRTREAIVELEKAVKDQDTDGDIFDHLGDAYRQAGQAEKAKQAWRHALEAYRKAKEAKKMKEIEQKVEGGGGKAEGQHGPGQFTDHVAPQSANGTLNPGH